MNYSIFIVKVVQGPEQSFFDDETTVTEMLVQFPQYLSKDFSEIFQISIWGNLAHDAAKYYSINDYLIIEGYLSLRDNILFNQTLEIDKHIEFTVMKLYPFLLENKMPVSLDKLEEFPF
jgi:hypothetical protein